MPVSVVLCNLGTLDLPRKYLTVLFVCVFRTIRVVARTSANFTREVKGVTQHISGHFSSYLQHVAAGHEFDIEQLRSGLDSCVDTFNARGSCFVIASVSDFTLVITQYRPMAGLTYVPTPRSIATKHAVVNVKNRDDRCFLWALLSCLHPQPPGSMYSYTKYADTLNFDGIPFPVKVKDIPKF